MDPVLKESLSRDLCSWTASFLGKANLVINKKFILHSGSEGMALSRKCRTWGGWSMKPSMNIVCVARMNLVVQFRKISCRSFSRSSTLSSKALFVQYMFFSWQLLV